MDFANRLTHARELMQENGIDLVYLTRGANLFYLTGIRRELEHGTDHNAFGDWACGAWFSQSQIVVTAPRMGGNFYLEEARDKPWIDDVHLIKEHEEPSAIIRHIIERVAGQPSRIALDERAWSQTALSLMALYPDATYSLASQILAPMRAIKDADEIEAMRRASALADEVWSRVTSQLQVGVAEFEVALEIERQFQLLGAEYTSFPTGVFFNGPGGAADSGTTRAGAYRTLQPGDSIMFDFGCVLDGYCSDFGRCAFVGDPPAEYVEVHRLVLEAQRAAIEEMKPEMHTTAALNQIARSVIEDAGHGEGFRHRLGHGMGVTVHEPPFLDSTDTTFLQENMVFTVEPSVIYPGTWGNRVEDVVRVTPAGGEVLNTAPHDLYIVD
jgi:Xaa-Pro dipeptidase